MKHHPEYEDEAYEQARPSLWARLKGWVSAGSEEDEDDPAPAPRTDTTVRYRRFHAYHIAIRREVQSLEDARLAADGLKEGIQQILNLASAPQGVRERIIDFLNGVVYAIEGSVEKVSEHVFVYAPPQAIIDAPTAIPRSRTDD